MDIDPNETVTVEMRWENGGWSPETYNRDITRRQLGDLLMQIDDMAETAVSDQWPAPETAYAKAPGIVREIGWTAQAAADKPFGTRMGREFRLRKAALLDRIALGEEAAGRGRDATGAAEHAAERLMDVDDPDTICDPRHYVRQQYALWAREQ